MRGENGEPHDKCVPALGTEARSRSRQSLSMRAISSILTVCVFASCAALPAAGDTASDAPDYRSSRPAAVDLPESYAEALRRWRGPGDVNAWIGARFDYDHERAARLSQSERARVASVQIHEPDAFFARPVGVCVDLARFALETLREVAPLSKASYLMIEFDPVLVSGNLLRRHWLVMFERENMLYFFADSKRPGHVAGPYPTVKAFLDEYATYRGRQIVSYRSLDSYERKPKKRAPKSVAVGGA